MRTLQCFANSAALCCRRLIKSGGVNSNLRLPVRSLFTRILDTSGSLWLRNLLIGACQPPFPALPSHLFLGKAVRLTAALAYAVPQLTKIYYGSENSHEA